MKRFVQYNKYYPQCLRFVKPEPLTTRKDKFYPSLTSDIKINRKHLNFATAYVKHMDGRLEILSNILTDLIKLERIEGPYHKLQEVQSYIELLIIQAIRNGDCHVPTMELANFWIKEKQLIHKLFKVLVPRYLNYKTSYTKIYNLGIFHEHSYNKSEFKKNNLPNLGVLELKENSLPPMPSHKQKYLNNKNTLVNILLNEAQKKNRKL